MDTVSCMTCVRGCLYHLDEDGDGDEQSRSGPVSDCQLFDCGLADADCLSRWCCLCVAAVLLPCIWCYLPLKGCAQLCECAYSSYTRDGCRCERTHRQPRVASHARSSAPPTSGSVAGAHANGKPVALPFSELSSRHWQRHQTATDTHLPKIPLQ